MAAFKETVTSPGLMRERRQEEQTEAPLKEFRDARLAPVPH
jgi:hypothetical protein